MRDRTRRIASVALVALLLVSTVAVGIPLASMSASAAASPPSGMVGVSSSNIEDIRASPDSNNLSESSLEGAVYVSDHASTTEVSIVTRDQAEEVANGASPSDVAREAVCSSPAAGKNPNFDCETTPALVISDEEHDDGRRVAIETDVIRDAIGYVPSRLTVQNNETGERWVSPTTVEDGYLIASFEHFSSNSVTFESEISVEAASSSNGTAFQYDLGDLDAASDPSINLTGVTNTETDSESSNGGSYIDVAGTGVKDDSLTVEGSRNQEILYKSHTELTTIGATMSETFNGPDTVERVTLTNIRDQYNPDTVTVEIRLVDPDGAGTVTLGQYTTPDHSSFHTHTVVASSPVSVTGSYEIVIELISRTNSGADFEAGVTNGEDSKWTAKGPYPSTVSATVDGKSYTFNNVGSGTVTKSVDLSVGSNYVSLSPDYGAVTWDSTYTEVTESVDPGVKVNGEAYRHDGTLADGETVSLSGNSSDLIEGENEVVVEAGDGSLSSDAPAPKVALNYSHDTLDRKTVNYDEEQWTVRYDTSKTFASERSNAWLNTTFEHEVVAMRDVEVRWNESGDFTAISSSNYQLDGNNVAVDIDEAYGGTIPTNTTVEVRLNGSRVDPHNMTISVDEATKAGDPLQSRISVESQSSDSYINVGPTADGTRIHYTENESWSDASTYSVITVGGSQDLHLPGASAGDAFTIRNLPTAAETDGDAKLTVEKAGEAPEIAVEPGPAGDRDQVTFTHYATTDGVKYDLFSETNGIVRDSATANSPVTLVDDDSDEVLVIQTSNTNTSSSEQSSGPYVPPQFGQETGGGVPLGTLAAIGIPVLGLAGAVVVYRRRDDSSSDEASTPVRATAAVGRAVSTGVRTLSGEPRVVAALGIVGGVALVLTGAIQLPPGSGLLLVIAGLPLVTFLVLQRLDSWSPIVFGTVSVVAVVLGLQLLGADPIGQVLDALGPGVLILGIGVLVLAYQAVQAARAPEEVNNINIGDGDA